MKIAIIGAGLMGHALALVFAIGGHRVRLTDTNAETLARAPGLMETARATLEAQFAIDDKTAVLGEVELGRLIGDAADSPVTQDRLQPAIRIGIVRRFSFGN